jgi:F-type H+-transporting ATPase subunit a
VTSKEKERPREMGPEFVGRVIRTSAWVAPLSALYVAAYYSVGFAAAVLVGAAWACANLYLIKILVGKFFRPAGGSKKDAILLGCVKFPLLYVLGYFALRADSLPILGLLAGFWLPKTIMILKSLGVLLNRRYDVRRGTVVSIGLIVLLGMLFAPQLGVGSADVAAEPAAVAAADLQREPGGGTRAEPASAGGESEMSEAGDAGAEAQHSDQQAETTDGGQEHKAGHGGEEGGTELPNFITVLVDLLPESSVTHFLHHWENLIFSLLSILVLGVVASAGTRRRQLIPGRLQNTVELLVESLDNFVCGVLGPRGRRYVPFLGSLFIYILFMNLFGLVPGMKSPTANLNQTLALSLCVFLYVQYTGIRSFGIKGYVFHMAGEPRDPITFALVPIMLPLHIIGELAKPLSLSLRLFGNITGEDVLIVIFVTLGIGMIGFLHLPFGIPLQVPFIFLAMLTSTIQALVFTLLSTVYFLMMMPHEEH